MSARRRGGGPLRISGRGRAPAWAPISIRTLILELTLAPALSLTLALAWVGPGLALAAENETVEGGRIVEIDKSSGRYLRLGGGRIRLPGGRTGEVEKEDEQTIWVRLAIVARFDARAGDRPTGARGSVVGDAAAPLPAAEQLAWQRFDRGLPESGQWRGGFAVADLNGDGHLDLASAPPRGAPGREPVIFLGDGVGGWRRWQAASFPRIAYDYGAAAVGDIDHDGTPDLALGMHLLGVVVLVHDGRGGFDLWSEGIERGGKGAFSSVALQVVDWDGDGKRDLLALGEGPTIGAISDPRAIRPSGSRGLRWYRNLGGGRWESIDLLDGRGAGLFGRSLAVADLDGDGDLDVAMGSQRRGEATLIALRGPDGRLQAGATPGRRAGALTETVTAGDLDGDGSSDRIVGYRVRLGGIWTSGVDLLRGSSGERVPLLGVRTAVGVSALALGDVNGDGRLELVAGSGGGQLWVVAASGEGELGLDRPPPPTPALEGCGVSALNLVDLDADGSDELLVAFAGEPKAAGGCIGGGGLRVWRAGPAG